MLTALIISQVLLWIAVAALVVLGLALARQVGVLHERVAPVGALVPSQGPSIGDAAPRLDLVALDGQAVGIGGPLAAGVSRLLLFVSPDCPICKKLIPLARRVARDDRLDLVFASDADDAALRAMIAAHDIGAYPFVNSRDLGIAYAVDKLPHAVMLSDEGLILSRGLVNSREHLESMVVARDLGVRSVQDYLSRRDTVAA